MEEPSQAFWEDNHETKASDQQCVKVLSWVCVDGNIVDESHL